MTLRKGTKFNGGYATVLEDEGVNYREIAEIMTSLGFTMNHSSARNYVLRVMRKFAEEIAKEWQINVPEERMRDIVSSPGFQSAIADLLHSMEMKRSHN